jgi:hypothetical protein
MYIPKRYGESKVASCPFCSKTATIKNSQDVPVCASHRDKTLPDMKCACGEYLDLTSGKYGPYFRCMKCGNINFRKGLEMNSGILENEGKFSNAPKNIDKNTPNIKKEDKKEITVTSDQVDVYYS